MVLQPLGENLQFYDVLPSKIYSIKWHCGEKQIMPNEEKKKNETKQQKPAGLLPKGNRKK